MNISEEEQHVSLHLSDSEIDDVVIYDEDSPQHSVEMEDAVIEDAEEEDPVIEEMDEEEIDRLLNQRDARQARSSSAASPSPPPVGPTRSQRRNRARRKAGRIRRRRPRDDEEEVRRYGEDGPGREEPRAEDFFGPDLAELADPIQTEEEAAGYVLPRMLPQVSSEIFLRELWMVIMRMGQKTTKILRNLLIDKNSVSVSNRKRYLVWIKYWTAYMVENHFSVVGEIQTIPTGPHGENEQISGTMGIMMELWRIKLILNHHRLRQLVTWKIEQSAFLVEWLFEMPGTPLDNADTYITTPVMYFKQSEIRAFVQYLTGRFEGMPYHKDIRLLVDIMEVKNAMFYCQTMPGVVMDDEKFRLKDVDFKPDWQREMEDAAALQGMDLEDDDVVIDRFTINRDYWVYTTSYFYDLVRRIYFVDQFPRMQVNRLRDPESYLPDGAVQRLKDWIEAMSRAQGDRFPERLEDAARESFRHPGDLAWLRYRYPDSSTATAASVRKTRGEEEYRNYHSTTELSREMVLARVNQNWTSTVYVVNIFDRYMDTYKGVKWRRSYVIRNADIDEAETVRKWTTTREPLLVEVFTGFWLMMDQKVWPIDDIYVAICMWLRAIHLTRRRVGMSADCVFGDTYIGDIIKKILDGREQEEVQPADRAAEEDYQDRQRRGLPQETTRVHI